MKILFLSLFTSMILIQTINSEVVCSEAELVQQIKEDIADNKKLDCLRESLPIQGETVDERAKRIAANWTGDCAFEADNPDSPWIKSLYENYPLIRGLVDVNGQPYENNRPTEADMCEIIRTFIGNNMLEGVELFGESLYSVNDKIAEFIECPQGICAATGGSYAEKENWYIFLDGQSIRFDDSPEYQVSVQQPNNIK